jgi:apolipoprotein N-acyltransferase
VSGGNDGVFASPRSPRCTLQSARLRAVETGRHRPSDEDRGSAIIDPTGERLRAANRRSRRSWPIA